MASIAEVIGWKFNNQPGMKCREIGGVLQIVEFPGGIPSQALQDQWATEYQTYLDSGSKTDQDCLDALTADKLKKLLFETNFDQENRLRVLEGKATITRAVYRAALQAAWRTL